VTDLSHVRTGFAYLDEPREAGGVLALAHRGGARHPDLHGLENTLTAFRHAAGLGYRYLETDVHATADGHLVAFHDDRLDRVTDRVGPVLGLPLSEVLGAVVGARAGLDERIPRLTDLLEDLPEVRFNIDLKAPTAVEPLADLVRRTGLHDRVCVASFTERTLRRFRRLLDRPVATATGPASVAVQVYAPFPLRVGRLLRDGGAVLQVPHRFRGRTVVDRRFVELAHASGRHVHVWTVDVRAEMEHLLDLGVDGLVTDRTDVCKEVLVERGVGYSGAAT
jgi:glycerophosphoryl diester phosphodiesterase